MKSRARGNPIFKRPLTNTPIHYGDASYFPPSNRKPKVVSIPVRFVGSETNSAKKIDPSIAAIKIQRVFRGFIVRKTAKIVREIEAEVDAIVKKFGSDREMDLIVGDARERLKINEMLMRLLFRLDSVRGVRDYRKKVIRRVILIQEMLDSISYVESNDCNRSAGESKSETLETGQSEKPDLEMSDSNSAVGSGCDQMMELKEGLEVDAQIGEAKTLGKNNSDQEMVDSTSTVNQDREARVSTETLALGSEIGDAKILEVKAGQEMVHSIVTADSVDQNLETGYHDLDTRVSNADCAIKLAETLETKPDEGMVDSILTVEYADQDQGLSDSMEIPQDLKAEVQNAEMKTLEHCNQALKAEDLKPENEDEILTGWKLLETNGVNEEEEENKKMTLKLLENENLKDVMERMVAENEKLKGLVVVLCRRSAQQRRLMGGLTERVEYLEKVVQKMEKKNKKKRKENVILPTSDKTDGDPSS